jgi:hypothetical protein
MAYILQDFFHFMEYKDTGPKYSFDWSGGQVEGDGEREQRRENRNMGILDQVIRQSSDLVI